ncbi:MAG: peptidylprolyl isomerase [Acidobacteria bacterium]|nr:peptidylprolyl isomerase [Acidobacteriota bacterium]MBI3658403.1 peptidylprolyl isomerase [Acidobacteriota bacterium]
MKIIWLITLAALLIAPALAWPEQAKKEAVPAKAEEVKAPAVDENKVIAQVGDFKLTLKELNDMISQYPPQFRGAFNTFDRKKNLVERILESKVFAMAAEKEGLEKDPEIQKQLQSSREQILTYAYQRKLSKMVNATDEEVKTYYDSHQKEFTVPEQVKARHILVKDEAEAKKLRSQLIEGTAKFEDLAKEKSIDRASKNRGGDLGWVSKGLRGEDFDKVAFTIEMGKLSEVFKTPTGFHILKAEEKKPSSLREFDKEKPSILRRLKANKEKDSIDATRKELWTAMKASIDEETLKAATPPPPPPEVTPTSPPGTMTPFGQAPAKNESKKPEAVKKP